MDTQHDFHPEHQHEHLHCDGEGHEHHHHEDGSCCCHHHDVEYHGVDKLMLARLIVAAICFFSCMIFPVSEKLEAVLMIAAGLIAGYDIIFAALKNLVKLRFFDEYFLMTFAAVAACAIGEFEEGAAVMLLYRIGETCQDFAIRRSKRKISLLFGDAASTGTEHHDGKAENFITKFARIYTPVILALAVLIAVVLPLFLNKTVSDSIYRALTFLVLACPCAIVISVPLSYFAGIGAASRKGIFFHDSTSVDIFAGKGRVTDNLKHVRIADGDRLMYSSTGNENISSAEVVFASDDETKVREAVKIAKKTKLIIHENIWFTIAIKLTVLVLAACGISALWFAVFADSGVTIVVILNSIRAFKAPKVK